MKIPEIFKDKRIRIILILVFLLIILIILNLLANKNQKENIEPILLSPTPKLNISPTISVQGMGDPNFYENIHDKTLELYPLFGNTPHRTTNYSLDYSKPMILEVKLKKDTPEIRQEVLNWILLKGVDPKTHTIIWKTQ